DTGEPENNDFLTLPEGNFIQDDNNLPLLFSFSDGEGGCLRDRDWYQYAGSRGDEVTIEISKPSVFDQIELQYFYEGDYSAPFIINSSHNPYEYIYAIPDPDSDQTPAVLYFSITPLSSVNENSFGPYSVCISSESFDPTEPVDPVDPADPGDYVQNPEASRLEYNDRIRLSWDKTIDVDEYVIYRGGSRSAAPVEIDRFSNTSAYIEYFDYTALADTHYYYQIRWMKGRVEYGSASPMVLGVRSDTTDIYEPLNNDFSTLNSGSYVPDSGNPPILYSFNDGDGLIEADTDWYRYEECKRGDMISVTVEKPIDFDQINLQFYHDGLLSETISIGSSIQEEFYPIPDPDNLREDTILFFRITPVAGISGNCIGSYSINVGNSL
ncbi:MAG: hypothetical protein JXR86_06970, partial [Spirochaetales bacterium]|nr:hypothetical protein [Spirochaetales bacterium]